MQGLVLQNQPNLKLFNQLYWVITSAFMGVFLSIFPIPHLIAGTFPAESRYCITKVFYQKDIFVNNLYQYFSKSILIKLIP